MNTENQAPEGEPSVMASGWTPVHLGLPPKFTEVMIAFAGSALPSTGQYTGNLRDSADGWSYPSENSGDDTDWTVTHWRPLPEHPEAYRFAGSPDAAALPAVQAPAEGDAPVGYLPAYELDRLRSGHQGNLRSARFGPSELDGDVPVYLRAAQPQPKGMVPDLRERLAEAHDASLDDDHRACRSILTECMRLLDAQSPSPHAHGKRIGHMKSAERESLSPEALNVLKAPCKLSDFPGLKPEDFDSQLNDAYADGRADEAEEQTTQRIKAMLNPSILEMLAKFRADQIEAGIPEEDLIPIEPAAAVAYLIANIKEWR